MDEATGSLTVSIATWWSLRIEDVLLRIPYLTVSHLNQIPSCSNCLLILEPATSWASADTLHSTFFTLPATSLSPFKQVCLRERSLEKVAVLLFVLLFITTITVSWRLTARQTAAETLWGNQVTVRCRQLGETSSVNANHCCYHQRCLNRFALPSADSEVRHCKTLLKYS